MISRYTPLTYTLKNYPYEEIDSSQALENYFQNIIPNFSEQEQYQLLNDANFIKKVITSDRHTFKSFVEYVLDNSQKRDLFFSANKSLFMLYKDNFKDCLNSISDDKLLPLMPQLLETKNNYLLNDFAWKNGSFPAYFMKAGYAFNLDKTNQYLLSCPQLFNGAQHLLKDIQVATPLTKEGLNFLINLKKACGYNPENKFYSLLDTSIVNAIIEGGNYDILANKDKMFIIDDMCNTHTEYGIDKPYTSRIFKQKDYLKYVIAYCGQDSSLAIKFLKYLDLCAPEVHDAYHKVLNVNIKNKEHKTPDDLAFIFFGDYLENVMLNLNVIKDYAKSNPKYKAKLDPATFNILTNINLDELTDDKEINDYFYALEKTKIDFSAIIYDYMSLARDTFANDVKESLTNINDCDEDYQTQGVNVHYYNGKNFSFIIHATSGKNGDPSEAAAYKAHHLNENDENIYLSTSYINQSNTHCYDDSSTFIFGYNNLDGFDLVSANFEDAFTTNSAYDPVNHPPTYLNLDDFSNHPSYSELLYKKSKMKPDFLICFAPPDEYEISLAKELKIDIVYINSQKYKNKSASKTSSVEAYYKK